MQIITFIKVSGKMEKQMVMVCFSINLIRTRVYLYMKDNLKMINNMDTDRNNGMVKKPITLVISLMERKLEKVNLYLMAMYIMENLLMENFMEKVNITLLKQEKHTLVISLITKCKEKVS